MVQEALVNLRPLNFKGSKQGYTTKKLFSFCCNRGMAFGRNPHYVTTVAQKCHADMLL